MLTVCIEREFLSKLTKETALWDC